MFKYLLSLIFLVILFFPYSVGSTSTPSKVYKIAIINSYDINHACTYPQQKGILDILNTHPEMFNIRSFYLNAKTYNITKESQCNVAKALLARLAQESWDYYFTTDDIAFELVGIPLLQKGYKVLSSGINKPLADYQGEFNIPKENLIVSEEIISLDDLFKIFNDNNIMFRPTKWYILYDDTETSFYMLENYEKELSKRGITSTPIKILTINKLETFLESIQNEYQGILVVTLQSIQDKSNSLRVSKERFMKIIRENNKIHLELTGNSLYAKVGFPIASGPDFEDMGTIIAKKLIENIEKKQWKHEILKAKSKTAVNKQRLEELNLLKFLNSKKEIKIYENTLK